MCFWLLAYIDIHACITLPWWSLNISDYANLFWDVNCNLCCLTCHMYASIFAADIFGRKKPLIASMAIMFVFNLICYFATDWVMFAVGRFFIGNKYVLDILYIHTLSYDFIYKRSKHTKIVYFSSMNMSECSTLIM